MKHLKSICAAFCFLGFISATAMAQVISGGITAGASFNTIKLDNSISNQVSEDKATGVEAGLYLKANFGGIYIRPMALASFIRGQIKTETIEGASRDEKFELTTLEVPVMAGFQLLPVLSFEAGPSWNYLMQYSEKLQGVRVNFDRHALGYRAGVRVHFARLGIFGHYGGIITEQTDDNFRLNRPSRAVIGLTLDLGNPD